VVWQELGREEEAGSSGTGGFSFNQLSGNGQHWQPAFLTSIDHRPSQSAETPTFALALAPLQRRDEPLDAEEDITPLSEVGHRPKA
jgi:hypothetical protein